MEIILLILIIIILFLVCYLFIMKKELRRIKKELDLVLSRKTNGLVHTEVISKEISDLVKCINMHLTEIKSKESQLERKNTNFVKMIRNISHDLRTPLTSSLGYVSLMLESDMTEEEKRKNLKVVEERLKRLSELIDAFFEFSKILSDNKKIELEEINLVYVIEKAISNHYEDFSKDKRRIDFKANKRKVIIKSNCLMLLRILDNLIRNAYKHSDGDLRIEVHQDDTKIKIYFVNNLLYNDLDVDRMFDEFYTVDISRTKGNTGLGLAIAKEFVMQLKGNIKAEKRKKEINIVIEFPLDN